MNNKREENLNLHAVQFDSDIIYNENDEIRELKDENGRLRKLLNEKSLELENLRTKTQDKKQTAMKSIASDLDDGAAAMKIIEISKKLRDTTAEMESLKTKYNEKVKEIKMIQSNRSDQKPVGTNKQKDTGVDSLHKQLQSLKSQLKTSEEKTADLTVKNDKYKQDLQLMERCLKAELGDTNLDIRKMLQDNPKWRGRAQKITSLSNQVEKLKEELEEMKSGDNVNATYRLGSGASSIGWIMGDNSMAVSNDDKIKLRKEKQLKKEKLEGENARLKQELEKFKKTNDGLKARNEVLVNDVTRLKKQISDMLEKANHDDELVASLLKRQEQLRLAAEANEALKETQLSKTMIDNQTKLHDINEIEQLKTLLIEKEKQIQKLKTTKQEKSITKESNTVKFELSSIDDNIYDETQNKNQIQSLNSEIAGLKNVVKSGEKRYEELIKKNLKISEEFSKLKQDYLQLEREMQKVAPNNKIRQKLKSIIKINSENDYNDSQLSALLNEDVTVSKDTIEQLQEVVEMKLDKIDNLQNALELMSNSKQQDLAMLTQILNDTRIQFVDAVQKLKSNS